ncbi:MAG: ferritin-like domain-containing protein [Sphingomonadales bacterium]
MTHKRWTLDDIDWDRFDPTRIDADILETVKAAALVEANSPDYVTYLKNVFRDDPDIHPAIEQWGIEEEQHGAALARWARLADPDFDFGARLKIFQDGFSLPLDAAGSVRGSRAGELIARCVVEVGTSSFYSAIRDAAREPVLAQICGHIARDEVRHYRLFRDNLDRFRAADGKLPLALRLKVALSRIAEAEDDELAYAFYAANRAGKSGARAYDRKTFARAYWRRAMGLYREEHIARALRMVLKAVDLRTDSWLARRLSAVLWRFVRWRAGRLARAEARSPA